MTPNSSQYTIVGCGAQARRVAHALLRAGHGIRRFLDDALGEPPIPGTARELLRDAAPRVQGELVIVAIGARTVRARLCAELSARGFTLGTVVHPTAIIAPDAVIAPGAVILAGAIIESQASVEAGAIIDVGAIVDHDAVVRAYAHIRPGVVVSAYTTFSESEDTSA